MENQNKRVCAELFYRFMQISVNVAVHGCQQQFGLKAIMSGLSFVQYIVKNLTFILL